MKAMPPVEARDLERLRYWQGQMLRSRDFRDQLAIAAQLRWWHNRAMHHTLGVAIGFEVRENKQQHSVLVEPGLAYDCFGREIILRHNRVLPVPASTESLTLLARYKDPRSLPQRAGIGKSCLAESCSPSKEQSEFAWKPSISVKPQDGVPLAGVGYVSGQPTLELKSVRPIARPLARSHIVSGATIAGATRWETWSIPFGERQFPIGFQVMIDTSAAGFSEVPCYFAWLQGQLWKLGGKENVIGVHWDHIEDVSTNGFTFRFVILIENLSPGEQLTGTAAVNFLQKQKFYVSWLGIQPSREPHSASITNEVHCEHT